MTAQLLLFFIFSFVLVISSLMVILARNPVHSVLFLILAFFNAAGVFILSGAELLAMTLIIVYVGAVAVLFLFVVMMFDVHLGRLGNVLKKYKVLSFCLGFVLLTEMVILSLHWEASSFATEILSNPAQSHSLSNAHAIGNILYTNYAFLFQVSGLILLVAIIGAIVLTLRDREGSSRRQDIRQQLERDPRLTVEMKKVMPNQGVDQ